ncbi:DUF3526 domain-containing protein [Pseudoalteromonas sp. MMG012]|uniref:DUF3526 domain-containing protein n=1 Tax=Pseudoalteromonas sp. MMG012 TaxID=2822686 RepID=UPI001B3A22DC|nr:DUF3526 domain-containing protein [Pseudoalteromonas sp. MMG012]MBQ4849488.1 DUF3526 domain-containing protein [Pseudoalteromonas sp. MMG012]
MLMITMKKEWLDSWRQGHALWISLIALMLLLVACVTSWQSFQVQSATKSAVAQSERDRWLEQGEKGPHSAAHYGVYVLKPELPLAMVDPGLRDFQGNVLRLEAHKRNDTLFRPIQDTIPMQRFGSLSPSFVLQILLPLLIILVGYPAFSGEREQGTLKQLLASGCSSIHLFIAKSAALFSVAAMVLIPLFAFLLYSSISEQHAQVLRSALYALSYLVYLSTWCVMVVAISCWLSTARRTLIVLLALWAISCLLIPKIAMTHASNQYPIESGQAFQSKLESEVYTPERQQAIAQFKQETLTTYGVSSTDDLPFDWSGAQLQFGEQYSDKVFDRLFGARSEQLNAQFQYYQSTALLSPFIAIQTISMGLAGSDHTHHHNFEVAAEKYRRVMQQTLNFNQRDHAHKATSHYVADKQLWQAIPEFVYQPPSFSLMSGHYLVALCALIGWLLFSGVLGSYSLYLLRKEVQR